MTNFKQLCADLLSDIDDDISYRTHVNSCASPDALRFSKTVLRARAALNEPEPEVYYEFSVLNDEYCIEAGGTAPALQQAIDEGRHYFAEYSQDGQYTLEVRRVETIPVTY